MNRTAADYGFPDQVQHPDYGQLTFKRINSGGQSATYKFRSTGAEYGVTKAAAKRYAVKKTED